MTIMAKDRTIVVPGEELAQGMDYIPTGGTYRSGDKIIAGKLGMFQIDGRILKIIHMSGRYMPKQGDTIIVKVSDITLGGWRCDINSAYSALLSVKEGSSEFIPKGADLTKYYSFGDYLVAKIVKVTSQNLVDLSTRGVGLRKLGEGRIMRVDCSKIPRIVGKAGSMINLIKDITGCRVSAGQNGIVWLQGSPENENLAAQAIQKIVCEGHISGMTDRVKEFLESKIKK